LNEGSPHEASQSGQDGGRDSNTGISRRDHGVEVELAFMTGRL